jgi:hypothetical protein
MNQIPRQHVKFLWGEISAAARAGARMNYVAIFDEIDEGTAIFKCSNEPPLSDPPGKFLSYEGVPSDHYLWLAGQGGRLLRGEIKNDPELWEQKHSSLSSASGGSVR